jgi:hypothetical protein
MRFVLPIVIIGVIVVGAIGVLIWHPWSSTTSATTTTLGIQVYNFTAPQGIFIISNVSYVTSGNTYNGEVVLYIRSLSANDGNVTTVSADGSTWTTPNGQTIPQTYTWVEVPGWNCGYSDDNGRVETNVLTTSNGNSYSFTYSCIYPEVGHTHTFTNLMTAPWSNGHTPPTIVP